MSKKQHLLKTGFFSGKEWRLKKTKEWTKNAGFWIKIIRENLDPYRLLVTNKAVVKAIGARKGLKILDAGCGEGYLCRILARKGNRVFGADISQSLVESARDLEKKNPLKITYFVGDFKKIPIKNGTIDIVLSHHTIYETNEPGEAIKEFSRLLKSGGRFIFLILHPCFDIDYRQNNRLPLSLRYFQKGQARNGYYHVGGIRSPERYFYLHLPLSSWIELLVKNGFVVTKLQEPHPPLALVRKDRWWKENFKWPMFILVEATKL